MAEHSDATHPAHTPADSAKSGSSSKANSPKKAPGTYAIPAALHQALRFAALVTAFENEGTDKEQTTADDILQEALIAHITKLQNAGIPFPPKVAKEFEKLKAAKHS